MILRIILEILAMIGPCVIGIVKFYQVVLTPGATIETLDFGQLANILSFWTLLAIIGFCVVRLAGNALGSGSGWLDPTRPGRWVRLYDRVVIRVLLALVAIGGLVLCDPLGDAVEALFWTAVRAFQPPLDIKIMCNYAAVIIQLAVTSLALVVLVRFFHRGFSWYSHRFDKRSSW
jgi:hypothetical protein